MPLVPTMCLMSAALGPRDDPGLPTSLLTVVATTTGLRRRGRQGLLTAAVLLVLAVGAGVAAVGIPELWMDGSPIILWVIGVVLGLTGVGAAWTAASLRRTATLPASDRLVLALLPQALLAAEGAWAAWDDVAEVSWADHRTQSRGIRTRRREYRRLQVVLRPDATPRAPEPKRTAATLLGFATEQSSSDLLVGLRAADDAQWSSLLRLLPELAVQHGFVFRAQDEDLPET